MHGRRPLPNAHPAASSGPRPSSKNEQWLLPPFYTFRVLNTICLDLILIFIFLLVLFISVATAEWKLLGPSGTTPVRKIYILLQRLILWNNVIHNIVVPYNHLRRSSPY
jgi:hypothetical protein